VVRRLTMAGLRCVLLEKAADILAGASKGNSALLHTGFDAPAGSLELACMQAGYREFMEIRERLNLPVLKTDAMVIAASEHEQAQLWAILKKAHQNGVADARIIDSNEVRQREPNLAPTCGALWVPGEHVIDPWSTPLSYITQAVELGAELRLGCELMD